MRGPRDAFLAVSLLLAPVATAEAPNRDRDLFYVTLLEKAGRGLSEVETAAWLVRHPDGREALVPWPPAGRKRSHSWSHPPPRGTVALLHTHPSTGNPRPSSHDVSVARRLGLPVFTISRWAIYRADADGIVSPVASRCWTPTIDWTLARKLQERNVGTVLVARGVSSRTTPDSETALR